MAKTEWPKLSETLAHPRELNVCQACGQKSLTGAELQRWIECDEQDRETPVVVVLCPRCADRIIEPHPRLYRQLSDVEPMPGAMAVCLDCQHQHGLTCRSPVAQINGGPGLQYEPMPSRAHVCRSPRRLSGWIWVGKPIERCSGKEVVW